MSGPRKDRRPGGGVMHHVPSVYPIEGRREVRRVAAVRRHVEALRVVSRSEVRQLPEAAGRET